jgi:3-hydroxymyristoyl/3-hydroxydecanoyl-(acyl carrier protein) dehydratase/1-acyl-sn-glycerol-3-phosphate acyltransferase
VAPALPDSRLRLGRGELERLAGGPIAAVFGPAFAELDAHRRRVRMPMPPLLLVDRVTGLWGVPGTMGRGRVVTETDVPADAWYLECGRMPPGLMVEAGQSDLLLISWLGADRENRGERVYRLLGCELAFHGDLPRPGETLRYDIRIDGHARHGAVRLFFFSYDCTVGDQLRLSVRGGQAGFFSDAELRGSAGVIWDPAAEAPRGGRVEPPARAADRAAFSPEDVSAFVVGDLQRCFGGAFRDARAHVRTPRIPGGRMRLLSAVTRFEPRGGPWGRGYLRAETDLRGDEWFFAGHFRDDPVMPGTLMCQAGLQAMGFYLAALGFTVTRDGWRFAPVTERPSRMVCRGQVTPTSRHMVYEVFVHEVWEHPEPTVYADILLTVDGLRVFHAERMGLRLVPDWPLSSRPDLLPDPTVRRRAPGGAGLDEAAVLACAWGQPSAAFGPAYAAFDGARRLPRLPGPPYLFMSRIRAVEGRGAGAWVEVEYDVPPDAWYFREGGTGAMPFCVLLEAAMQPCGWLTAYLGIPLSAASDLHFRNLDGTAVVAGEVRPDAGTLVTRAEVRQVSRAGTSVIEGFRVRCACGERTVVEMETVFGHFTGEALAQQVGLPGPERGADGEGAAGPEVDLAEAARAGAEGSAVGLPGPELRMLDRVTGWWPHGGRRGLGRMRAVRRVDPGDWFFRAHFFQDPVQPGSLGIEAMLQLLQVHMLAAGLARGIPAPALVPVVLGTPLTWKYRGQVAPTAGEIEVEIEITDVRRDAGGPLALAEGWLSVDGRPIYHASGLAMRIVPGQATPDAASPDESLRPPPAGPALPRGAASGSDSAPEAAAPDPEAVRRHWRARLGTGPWVGEDVHLALLGRFVRTVSAPSPAVRGRPVLFLANHQTGIESLLFCTLAPVLHGTPVVALAKAEHRSSWLGGLTAELARYPGIRQPESMVYFDRADPGSLPGVLGRLRERMRQGASVLIHVEGTRALAARHRVARMSGAVVDLALAAGAPIVPVRFAGGLPVRPAPERLEFPVGFGAQDHHCGRVLDPEALRGLTLAQRTAAVLEAIAATGPALESEEPNPPDPAFAQEVAAHMAATSCALGDAVVFRALCGLEDPCGPTRALLGRGGPAPAPEPLRAWLAAFARRLRGPADAPGDPGA